ncbi:DNA mismatch repair protein MutT [Tissierella sp. P1]|uniref:NUDIX hydrolase n=1 Tax=unclassified Tissierella TaxID=2638726 RepID=UPI000BA06A78|nr:NUDIX hydrolase [Tissierella sp. P1]MDU5082910.1 NUDIX hydrolase [Bacillota bacterium]OZV10486.1 DNA mismatch repair protein MutT [Tissierella sp. P1]
MKKVNVVYCLIYNEESKQILMVYNCDSDSWSMPGGAVEKDETLEQAVIREVREETGLLVKIKDVAAVNECFFEEEDEHVVFITFRGEIIGGNISIENPQEISEIVWVDIWKADELMPYYKFGIEELIHKSATYFYEN